ncbi:MAG: sulfotransferase [Bacteroidales bacterium]|nr:sulfotransferase [Bacteroidales bacterium]
MQEQTIDVDTSRLKSLPFFFILGRPRSGTTLLRTMLDAHPQVVIPQESPLILNLYKKYGHKEIWEAKDLVEFFRDLHSQQIFGIWNIDPQKVREDLLKCAGRNQYQSIIKVVYSNFNSVFPKKDTVIFGDKNPVYSYNLKRLFPVFSEARYIHITRDYRDQLVSLKKIDVEMPHPALVAYRWKISQRGINKFKDLYPEKFYTLRYEDLVINPEIALKQLCNFLNLDYHENMLEFNNGQVSEGFLPEEMLTKYQSSLFQPISGDKINSWKENLALKQIKMADMVAGFYAEKAGYQRLSKTFNFFIFLQMLPVLMYAKFWNYSRRIIWILPFGVQQYIRNKSLGLPALYIKIFGKI